MTPARPAPPAVVRKAHRSSETATVRAIVDYLRLKGYLAWRLNSRVVMLPGKGGRPAPYRMGGVKGMADIVGIKTMMYSVSGDLLGRFFAIEVKSATGKPTPEQTAFLQAVVKAGGLAFVARSIADVQAHGL